MVSLILNTICVLLVSREQNTRLMQQQKGQHRNEETTVIKSQGSTSDWVHVEHPLHMVWKCVCIFLVMQLLFMWLFHRYLPLLFLSLSIKTNVH